MGKKKLPDCLREVWWHTVVATRRDGKKEVVYVVADHLLWVRKKMKELPVSKRGHIYVRKNETWRKKL